MITVFIDESGAFLPLDPPRPKVSCIAAVIVASTAMSGLLKDFRQLATKLPLVSGEVKGSRLDEAHVSSVLAILARHGVLVEVVAIDAGAHAAADVAAFRHTQAQHIARHAERNPDPRVRALAARLDDDVRGMPDQLFVQAWLTMHLILRVAQTATLFYALRAPRELDAFEWVVDAKAVALTAAEHFWTRFVLPASSQMSSERPFLLVDQGDYTHFARFLQPSGAAQTNQQVWSGGALPSRGTVDFRTLLTERLTFGDSASYLGLQMADVIANATARAFNNRLRKTGWRGLRDLFVGLEPQAVQLISLVLDPERSGRRVYLSGDQAAVMRALQTRRRLLSVP